MILNNVLLLAHEAIGDTPVEPFYPMKPEALLRFAQLVAEKEREECLKECTFGRSSADIEIAIRKRSIA